MTSSSPTVATTSPSHNPAPVRVVAARVSAGSPNIRFATTAPATPPPTWAVIKVSVLTVVMAPKIRSRMVTSGLNAAETGCSATTSAASAAPVATLFSSSCSPRLSGDSRAAAIPEPITAATRKPVPMASAAAWRSNDTTCPAPVSPDGAGVAGVAGDGFNGSRRRTVRRRRLTDRSSRPWRPARSSRAAQRLGSSRAWPAASRPPGPVIRSSG